MSIVKSEGVNTTEKILASLCDNVFLKLWAYPNPYNRKGKELCDVLVVFEDQIYIFSVKDVKFNEEKDLMTAWKRWKRKAIDASIEQINGAERWIKEHPNEIFLDMQCTKPFPLKLHKDMKIYKIIVAHGAEDACIKDSPNNINGSLAISYIDETKREKTDRPFLVSLNMDDIIHILDSYNLEIILQELDTFTDLSQYFQVKEKTIKQTAGLTYCGEEDLLGNYLDKFSIHQGKHSLLLTEDLIYIIEGGWEKIAKSKEYINWKKQNQISYFWDDLLQLSSEHALNGTLKGSGLIFNGSSALIEMAKEHRNMRRLLSERILDREGVIKNEKNEDALKIFAMPSSMKNVYYIIFQHDLKNDDETRNNYKKLLATLCETFVTKRPNIEKIIGIGINTFSGSDYLLADFALLNYSEFTDEWKQYYIDRAIKHNLWDDKNIIGRLD